MNLMSADAPLSLATLDPHTRRSDAARHAWQIARRTPASIVLAAALLGVGFGTGTARHSAASLGLVDTWGWGTEPLADGRVWTLLTGLLLAPEPSMFLLNVVGVLAGAGYLEYRYGTLRMLTALLVTHAAAVLITLWLLSTLGSWGVGWAEALSRLNDVGISNAAFGAFGVTTSAMPLLWRRRARLVTALYLLALVVYVTDIWDFTHTAAFAIGVAMGPWLLGRRPESPTLRLGSQGVRDSASVIVIFSACHQVLDASTPGLGGVLDFGRLVEGEGLQRLGVMISAVVSVLFAYALHHGKRVAWWVVLSVTAVRLAVLATTTVTAASAIGLAIDGVQVAILVAGWRAFRVPSSATTSARVLTRVAVGLGALLALGVLAILTLRGAFQPRPTVRQAVAQVADLLTGRPGALEPTNWLSAAVLEGIPILITFGLLAALAIGLLSTRLHRTEPSLTDRYIALQEASESATSNGYMTRWRGIGHWVAADGSAGIGFKLVGNTAIVFSDPVGSDAAVAACYDEFDDYCRSRGWRAAYFAVSERVRGELEACGYFGVQVAEDAVIPLATLAFTGKKWQNVRTALSRAEREGVTLQSLTWATAPGPMREQITAIVEQWAQTSALPEMGFTLGGLREADDPNVLIHVAVDREGTVHGLTSWIPVYRGGAVVGWTVDMMKRRLGDGVMPGVMEFLIAQSARTFADQGYEFASLASAPLSYAEGADGPLERFLDITAKRLEPWYGFGSLERFKSGFSPVESPLYLCFRDPAQLPVVTGALLRAYFPDAGARDVLKAASSR